MSRGSIRINAADIFEMPLFDGRRGYGQVIVGGDVLYVVVFRDIYDDLPDLDELIKKDILLVGWTLDALIYHGRWRIVGNRQPLSARVPFPSYKVRVIGEPYAHDFGGGNYRSATAEDWELLDYKTTVAPIMYQRARFARHGVGEWTRDYEELTVEHARRRQMS